MLSYVEVHGEVREHVKTYTLADELGVPQYAAVGLLTCLWTWAADNTLDGDLGRYPSKAIARAAFWDGNPDEFLLALVETGWLDSDLKIHDWKDFGGKAQAKRAADRERKRNSNGSRTEFQRKSDGIPTELTRNSSVPIEEEEEEEEEYKERGGKKDFLPSPPPSLTETYEKAMGREPDDTDKAWLARLAKRYKESWVSEAIWITADRGKKSKSYVEGILRGFAKRGASDQEATPVPISTGIRKNPALAYEQRTDSLEHLYTDIV